MRTLNKNLEIKIFVNEFTRDVLTSKPYDAYLERGTLLS